MKKIHREGVFVMAIFKVAAIRVTTTTYIEYDTETKELGVHLNDDAMDEKARQYLTTEKALHQYTDLSNYKTLSVVPTSSLEALKLALCYIWRATGIHIDWSRPVD